MPRSRIATIKLQTLRSGEGSLAPYALLYGHTAIVSSFNRWLVTKVGRRLMPIWKCSFWRRREVLSFFLFLFYFLVPPPHCIFTSAQHGFRYPVLHKNPSPCGCYACYCIYSPFSGSALVRLLSVGVLGERPTRVFLIT